ncbi:MAG: hypothetical protein QRY72_00460 [Candidatus Rhabdochlamydia sp.]
MRQISACITTGTIEPLKGYSDCKMELNSSVEQRFFSKVLELDSEECQQVDHHLQQSFHSSSDETVWKQSILMKMAMSSRIHAMMFIPVAKTVPHILLIQKIPSLGSLHLPSSSREEGEVIQRHFTLINQKSIEASLVGMDPFLESEVKPILTLFLKDPTTSSLEMGYFDENHCSIINRWSKKEESDEQFSVLRESINQSFIDLM